MQPAKADFKLSPLEKKVYAAVLSIPLGEVRSYAWLARRAGKPRQSRQIGQILKRNPFLFLVPCHRIIKSNGELGGYVLGVKVKKGLLDLEKKVRKCLLSKE